MNELVTALIGVLAAGLSSVITFFITRKKYNEEVRAQHIENSDTAFEAYKKIMKETLALQDKKIDELEKENAKLKEQVNQLQLQIATIISERGESPRKRKDK